MVEKFRLFKFFTYTARYDGDGDDDDDDINNEDDECTL